MGLFDFVGNAAGTVWDWGVQLVDDDDKSNSVLQSIGNGEIVRTIAGFGEAAYTPIGLTVDLATTLTDPDNQRSFIGTLSDRGAARFQQAMLAVAGGTVLDEQGNVLQTSSGLGAAFDILPEPVIRQTARAVLQKPLESLDVAAQELIREPLATAFLFGSLSDSATYDGSVVDALRDAHRLSQSLSVGQAAYLMFATRDILNEEEWARAFNSDGFNVASGIVDGLTQIFLDFDAFKYPASAAVTAYGRRTARWIEEIDDATGITVMRRVDNSSPAHQRLRAWTEPKAAPVIVQEGLRAAQYGLSAGKRMLGEVTWPTFNRNLDALTEAAAAELDIKRATTADDAFTEAQLEVQFAKERYDKALADDPVLEEWVRNANGVDLGDAVARADELADLVGSDFYLLQDFMDPEIVEALMGTSSEGVLRAEANVTVPDLAQRIVEQTELYEKTNGAEGMSWGQARRISETINELRLHLDRFSHSSSSVNLHQFMFMRRIAERAGKKTWATQDGFLYRGQSLGVKGVEGVDRAELALRRGSTMIDSSNADVGYEFDLALSSFSREREVAEGFGDDIIIKVSAEDQVGINLPKHLSPSPEDEVMLTGRFRVTDVEVPGGIEVSADVAFDNVSQLIDVPQELRGAVREGIGELIEDAKALGGGAADQMFVGDYMVEVVNDAGKYIRVGVFDADNALLDEFIHPISLGAPIVTVERIGDVATGSPTRTNEALRARADLVRTQNKMKDADEFRNLATQERIENLIAERKGQVDTDLIQRRGERLRAENAVVAANRIAESYLHYIPNAATRNTVAMMLARTTDPQARKFVLGALVGDRSALEAISSQVDALRNAEELTEVLKSEIAELRRAEELHSADVVLSQTTFDTGLPPILDEETGVPFGEFSTREGTQLQPHRFAPRNAVLSGINIAKQNDFMATIQNAIQEQLLATGPMRHYLDSVSHANAEFEMLNTMNPVEFEAGVTRYMARQFKDLETLTHISEQTSQLPRLRFMDTQRRELSNVLEAVRTGEVAPGSGRLAQAASGRFSDWYRDGPFGTVARSITSPFDKRSMPNIPLDNAAEVHNSIDTMLTQAGFTAAERAPFLADISKMTTQERFNLVDQVHDEAVRRIAMNFGIPEEMIQEVIFKAQEGRANAGRIVSQRKYSAAQVDGVDVDVLLRSNGSVDTYRGVGPLRATQKAQTAFAVDYRRIQNDMRRIIRKGFLPGANELRPIMDKYDEIIDGLELELADHLADSANVAEDAMDAFEARRVEIEESIDQARAAHRSEVRAVANSNEWAKFRNNTFPVLNALNGAIKANLIIRPAWALRFIGLDEGLRVLVMFGAMSTVPHWNRAVRRTFARSNLAFRELMERRLGALAATEQRRAITASAGVGLAGGLVAGPIGAIAGAYLGNRAMIRNLDNVLEAGFPQTVIDTKIGKIHVDDIASTKSGQAIMAEVSGQASMHEAIRGTAKAYDEAIGDARNWTTVSATDNEALHASTWANVINRQIIGDELTHRVVEKILDSKSSDEVVRWLESPDAAKYREGMDHINHNPELWVELMEADIIHITGGRADLMEKIRKGEKVSEDTLRGAFPNVADRPNVHGPEMDMLYNRTGGIGKAIQGFVDRAVHALGEVPSNEFVKEPMMRLFYEREIKRILDGRIEQGFYPDGTVPIGDLRQIEEKARRIALDNAKQYLYEFAARNEFHNMIAFISPFFPAAQEAIKAWVGIAYRNPAATITAVSLAQDLTELPFKDEDGNLVIPVPGFVGNALGEGALFAGVSDAGDIRIPLKSLNLIAGGDFFSGPVVRYAASEIVKREPALEDALGWALPFGPSDGLVESFGGGMVRNAWAKFRGEQDDRYEGIFIRMVMDLTTKVRLGEADFGDLTQNENRAALFDEAHRRAQDYFNLQFFSSGFSPAPIIPNSPFQMYIDAAQKMKRENPETWFEDFLATYGEEYLAVALGTTKAIAGVPPTQGGYRDFRQFEDVIRQYPQWGSFIAGNTTSNDDLTQFSSAVYEWQLREELQAGTGETIRRRRTASEVLDEPDIRMGWEEYIRTMEWVDVQLMQRGLTSTRQSGASDLQQTVAQVREYLFEKYPAWRRSFEQRDSGRDRITIEGAREMTQHPLLSQRPDVQAIGRWLSLYDHAVGTIERNGLAKSLDAVANTDIRITYEAQLANLLQTDPAFAPIYYRYFENINIGV